MVLHDFSIACVNIRKIIIILQLLSFKLSHRQRYWGWGGQGGERPHFYNWGHSTRSFYVPSQNIFKLIQVECAGGLVLNLPQQVTN